MSSSSKYCNWCAILQSECRACLLARSFTWHLSLHSWRCWASTQVLLVQCCSTYCRSCFVLFYSCFFKQGKETIGMIEGSLEVKLPTIWTDGKAEVVRAKEEKRREEKRRRKTIKKRKSQKKEVPGARKCRKVVKHCVFPMICGSGVSKSRLAKAAGAEPAGQMRDEKEYAVVVQSTCPSQKCKKLTGSEHFWKLRCRKSAHR